MTGRLVAVAVLATVVAAIAAGATTRVVDQASWWQQLRDAQTALEADTTALQAAPLTGQPVGRLLHQCADAVQAYDQAAAHLGLALIPTDQECQTPERTLP